MTLNASRQKNNPNYKKSVPYYFPQIEKPEKKEAKSFALEPNQTLKINQMVHETHSHHNATNTQNIAINPKLSNKTNENCLKNILKQRIMAIPPLNNDHIPRIAENKKESNLFQIVTREIKRGDRNLENPKSKPSRTNSRERSTRINSKEHSLNSTNNNSHNSNNSFIYSNGTNNGKMPNINEKKEKEPIFINKTNNLIKIYNPSNATQNIKKRLSFTKPPQMKKEKEKKKKNLENPEKKNNLSTENPDPEKYVVTMSFGNSELKQALGLDIQQIIDKGLKKDESSAGNINIIGNVNYENINFNFTFSKNDFSSQEKDEKINENSNHHHGFIRRKSTKKKETQIKSHSFHQKTNSKEENELVLNELKIQNDMNYQNYIDLRATPTFTLPMTLYKQQSQNEIEKKQTVQEEKNSEKLSKVEAPNIFSNDFLLDDLKEDLKKNGLYKYHDENNEEIYLSNKEKSPKNNESTFEIKTNKNEKCLLIDFENENERSSDDSLVMARNNTPNEDLTSLKIIKTKNLEVLDLNDL